MPTTKENQEIDKIVDRVVDDKAKARALKEALHGVVTKDDTAETAEEDDEDIWDDVPV